MTKPRPCDTSLPPSRLCRLLLVTFAFKLAVLGMLILEPAGFSALPFLPGGEASGTASAATNGASPAAPPSVEATLPDAGMQRPSPGAPGSGSGLGAAPGISAPLTQETGTRALPAIEPRPQTPPAQSNATAESPVPGVNPADILARRQEDLARKEQELRVLESELTARLERMQLLENRLSEMIKDAEETSDAKFRHLVDVLSNMKSKQAAAVLETLDPKIAVRVLAGMRGRQAGEILTFVKPEVAAKLTEDLARMQLPLE